MAFNIEIKAAYRIANFDSAHEKARMIGATYVGLDHQIDTYWCTNAHCFNTSDGRFKLRNRARFICIKMYVSIWMKLLAWVHFLSLRLSMSRIPLSNVRLKKKRCSFYYKNLVLLKAICCRDRTARWLNN